MASGVHGGAEVFYEDLVRALQRSGVDQACVIRPYPMRAALLSAAGARVSTMVFGGPLDLVTPWKLRKVAATENPDIIMGWMNRACRILPKGPWVNVGRLGGYYGLKYYRRCKTLICNTPDIVDYVVREGWSANDVHYIPNFCPTDAEPAIARGELDTPADAKVLLILARLHEAKGIDVALKALPAIPGAYLWIAGEGPLERHLKNLAADLKVENRVRFLGWRDDRAALLRAADVCLVPSRHEPFGNVVVNAWTYGVPVIAAAAQGPDFLIEDGVDGLKAPVGDVGALAAAVNAVIRDEGLGKRLMAGGEVRVAREFSEKTVVNRYREVFESLTR